MKYFNGFSLYNEEKNFKDFLPSINFCVAGFSFGAQQALEHAYRTTKRIDRLILLSPAFFNNAKPAYIRAQLRYFSANKEAYVKHFIQNVSYPSSIDLSKYLGAGTEDELEQLLTYKWDTNKLRAIQNKGTKIEVFLGSEDKIIDSNEAYDFFKSCSTTYFIKEHGHLLQECSIAQ